VILALTTTTPRCTVALVEADGSLLAREAYEDEMNHAERLFLTLDTLFAKAERTRDGVTLVACDIGPGSFTGVRVGLSSAKGIALGLSVPLIGVGSLEAMCAAALHLAPPKTEVACALIDAKRGETFIAAYDRDGRVRMAPRFTLLGEAASVIAAELDVPTDAVTFCGRASAREGTQPIIDDAACELPSATWIARIAARREAPAEAVDLIEPVYVRAPDAKPMRPPPTSA
jgi:tRNA threonylcarbamoyladenosine biosynthesis protein TsaB